MCRLCWNMPVEVDAEYIWAASHSVALEVLLENFDELKNLDELSRSKADRIAEEFADDMRDVIRTCQSRRVRKELGKDV